MIKKRKEREKEYGGERIGSLEKLSKSGSEKNGRRFRWKGKKGKKVGGN